MSRKIPLGPGAGPSGPRAPSALDRQLAAMAGTAMRAEDMGDTGQKLKPDAEKTDEKPPRARKFALRWRTCWCGDRMCAFGGRTIVVELDDDGKPIEVWDDDEFIGAASEQIKAVWPPEIRACYMDDIRKYSPREQIQRDIAPISLHAVRQMLKKKN